MKRKLFAIFMSFTLIFTMMPLLGSVAYAEDPETPPEVPEVEGEISEEEPGDPEESEEPEDTRIPVTEFEIQFNENSNSYFEILFAEPVLGAYVPVDSFCKLDETDGLIKGEPAYLERVTWQRKNEDGTWTNLSPDNNNKDIYIEGTYRLSAYLFLKRNILRPQSEWNFNFYRIDPECTVRVNGEDWSTGESDVSWLPGETSLFTWSKEYVLEDDGTLPLNAYNFELNNADNYLSVGKAIKEVNIYNKAVFGKKPYTFEKIDGPSWINVTSEGVVSGTPDVQNPNTSTLTVRVTDSNDPAQTKEITCPIGTVGPRLEDRIKVHKVVINHEMFNKVPRCNDAVDVRWLYPQAGEDGAYENPVTLSDIRWLGNWQLGPENEFEIGMSYRTSCYLWIYPDLARYDKNGNKMNSQTHVLANDCKLIINGVEWEKTRDVVDKTDGQLESYMSFRSPKSTAVRVTHTPSAPPTSEVVTNKATFTADGTLERTFDLCTVCGKENYVQEDVIPKVSNVKLSTTAYTYSGGVKTPSLYVKDSKGNSLKYGTDYTYTRSSGRKNVGTYKYYITLKGNYSGSKTVTFKINPKGTTIKTPYRYKGAIKARWSKQSSKMTKSRIYGYQIAYATKSDFSNAKYAYSNKYKYTSKKISKLKRKTYYYVKVRTRMKVGGVWHYSSWSKVKKVKTK